MAELELRLKYKNEDFGKPYSDSSYGIRNDIKTYELFVDGTPVINIGVEYERFSTQAPNYACAHVTYDNYFYLGNNPEYLNKGYASIALEQITEELLKENQVPKISLSINKDNLPSLRVAEKTGYKYIKTNEYSIYNPNAIKMVEEGLKYLKEIDAEIYDMQMYSWLTSYRTYIEQCLPKKKEQSK